MEIWILKFEFPMNIIIFGPQGSGKGTQAELIAREHDLPYISTGDIFRYHIKNKTELGKIVSEYTDSGNLVPDEITNKIVAERIMQPDCARGFVLDGYPRNIEQLNFLNTVAAVDFAVEIDIDDKSAIERLSGRRACKCGLSYHLEYNPPRKQGICDKCGAELFIRDDDKPDAIKKRLEIYHEKTKPLLAAFLEKNVLFTVDGKKSIPEVYRQINEVIHKHKSNGNY